MTTARRLNIPLSVFLALGMACGLGGVSGLVGAAQHGAAIEAADAGVELVGLDQMGFVDQASCRGSEVPTPRLRSRTPCRQVSLSPRFAKPLGR